MKPPCAVCAGAGKWDCATGKPIYGAPQPNQVPHFCKMCDGTGRRDQPKTGGY